MDPQKVRHILMHQGRLGVTAALAAHDANRNGDDRHTSGTVQSSQHWHLFSSAGGTFLTSSGNFFWQWELITGSGNALSILFPTCTVLTMGELSSLAVGTSSGSGNSTGSGNALSILFPTCTVLTMVNL
nr:hypothetical protein [Tanacetum cinerariifolium]